MKGINLMLAGLFLLAMISGCPAAGTGEGETAATGDEMSLDTSAVPEFVLSDLALDGIKLGTGSAEILARYAPETGAETYPMWGEEGVLGIVRAMLDPATGEPVETCVFMDSRLVGFTRMLTISAEDYAVMLADMTTAFGEPTAEPPEWAQATPFYQGDYQPVPEELNGNFWCDEKAHVMLAMIYSTEEGAISANLIDLERLNEAADATMAAMAPPEMGTPEGLPDGMPPEGAVVPEGEAPPADGADTEGEAGSGDETGNEGEAPAPEDETPAPEEEPVEGE